MTPQEIIRKSIRRGAGQVRALAIAEGALALVIFAGAFLLVEIALDHALTLAAGTRAILLAFLVAGMATLATSLVLLPLVRSVSATYVAHRIETAFPHFKNSLVTFVELDRSQADSEISPLVALQAANGLEGVDVAAGLDSARFTRLGYGLVALVIAAAVYGAIVPKSIWVSMLRAIHPWADIPASSRLFIADIEPGSARVPVGTNVTVTARVTGGTPENVTLRWSRDGELWQSIPMRALDGRWSGTLEHLETSILYAIRADDAASQKYTIAALARPVVDSVSVRVEPPGYTGLAAFEVSGGNVRASEGSTVGVTIRSNKELARAELRFGKTKSVALTASGESASGSFKAETSGRYVVALEDRDGLSPANLVAYEITVVPDAVPEVAVAGPPGEKPVGVDEACDYAFSGRDDYGVTRLVFHYESDPSNADAKAFTIQPASKAVGEKGRYSARDLGARPGDTVSYYVEGYDNHEGRANSSRSPTYTFKVAGPGAAEVGAAKGVSAESLPNTAIHAPKHDNGVRPAGAEARRQDEQPRLPTDGTKVAQARDKLREMMEKDKDAWQAIMKNLPSKQGAQAGDGQPVSAQASQGAQAEEEDGQQPQAPGKEESAQTAAATNESQASSEAPEGAVKAGKKERSAEGWKAPEAPATPGNPAANPGGLMGPSDVRPPDGKAQPSSAGQSPGNQGPSKNKQSKPGSESSSGSVRPGESQQQTSSGGAQPMPGEKPSPADKGHSSGPTSDGKDKSPGGGQAGTAQTKPGSGEGDSSSATGSSGGSGASKPRRDFPGGGTNDAAPNDARKAPGTGANESINTTREAVQRIQGELASGRTDPSLLKDLGWTPSELRTFVAKYRSILDTIDASQSGEGGAVVVEESSGPGGVVSGARGVDTVGTLDSSGVRGEGQAAGEAPREEVAPEYKALVDEYYRSLAEGKR